ncbi:MAG TPA: carboxymuconolactone decarboxylase family protein [Verrucomicrobiae bacterium]|nr:carboxymuconolactone decarboxylase family protein [Verrucomicrobiae bacterium]
MPRINPLKIDSATGPVRSLLDSVNASHGFIPNLFRTLAQSEVALRAYLNLRECLTGGLLEAKLRAQIALTVTAINDCPYCLGPEGYAARAAGLKRVEIVAAWRATALDPRADAALKFAVALVIQRGKVTDTDYLTIRQAGFSDGEIAEIVAHVALNIFANYFSKLAELELDAAWVGEMTPRYNGYSGGFESGEALSG